MKAFLYLVFLMSSFQSLQAATVSSPVEVKKCIAADGQTHFVNLDGSMGAVVATVDDGSSGGEDMETMEPCNTDFCKTEVPSMPVFGAITNTCPTSCKSAACSCGYGCKLDSVGDGRFSGRCQKLGGGVWSCSYVGSCSSFKCKKQ